MTISNISNYDVYTQRMKVGMYDKCWWVDKIYSEIDTVIDFGCADGALREALEIYCPQIINYYGIENNEGFYDTLDFKGISYYSDIMNLPNDEINWDRTIIVMNSVVHEILTYQGISAFRDLLHYFRIFNPRHIAIRDMCLTSYLASVYDPKYYNTILGSNFSDRYWDFIISHPNYEIDYAEDVACAVEFFLKYTYRENWQREKNECYLWAWPHQVLAAMEGSMRVEVSEDFRIVPQIRQIERDFCIKLPDDLFTHHKMLLTREKK